MAFVDKPRNSLTSSPERNLSIGGVYFLTIQSSFKLIIQAAVDATNWTETVRNNTPSWSDHSRNTS